MSSSQDKARPLQAARGGNQGKRRLTSPRAVVNDGVFPHSIEAEQGTLGCILLDPAHCLDVCCKARVIPEHFYDLRHRTIYETALELKTFDLITLQQHLRDRKKLELVGGLAYLSSLPDFTPSAANLTHYLDLLVREFKRRSLLELCSEIGGMAYEDGRKIDRAIDCGLQTLEVLATYSLDNQLTAIPIGTLPAPSADDGTELLKDRFLCRGGGLLLVGQSGQGKSSLALQMAILWCLCREAFGIRPARKLRVLLIQSENDSGDLHEMFNGVCDGLGLSAEDRALAGEVILVHCEDSTRGQVFFDKVVEPLVKRHQPDLLIIDPAHAYLEGDSKDAEAVGMFLRQGLNPILHRYNCAALVVHHTTKSKADGKQSTSDFLYAGSGSAEFTNWTRALLALETIGDGVYRLHAPKRGRRLGWCDDAGEFTLDRYIRHTRTAGRICWEPAEAVDSGRVTGSAKTNLDLLALVPTAGSVPQTTLLDKGNSAGIGQKRCRAFLDELVNDGALHIWLIKRPGTNPEKRVSRHPKSLEL